LVDELESYNLISYLVEGATNTTVIRYVVELLPIEKNDNFVLKVIYSKEMRFQLLNFEHPIIYRTLCFRIYLIYCLHVL